MQFIYFKTAKAELNGNLLGKWEMGKGKWERGNGKGEEASGADKIENLKLKVGN